MIIIHAHDIGTPIARYYSPYREKYHGFRTRLSETDACNLREDAAFKLIGDVSLL